MKTSLVCTAFFIFFISLNAFAQSPDPKKLLELDKGWERALLESDVTFLENLLADEFVWVHNHASLTDGKSDAISRAKRIQSGRQVDDIKGRTSRDQKVVILGNTGVVSGYTVVDRGPSPVTYHFMRTYALVADEWKLLANHTMAIPDDEE